MTRPEPVDQPTMVEPSNWSSLTGDTESNSREGWAVRQIIPVPSGACITGDVFVVYEWIGEQW
jgi:hypothetical protein